MKIVNIKTLHPKQGEKPNVELLLNTGTLKEIQISFTKGQKMAEHTAPGAIVVMVYKGVIEFGVGETTHLLTEGDMISLEANVPHDLLAKEDSIVRLTLSPKDDFNRVKMLANN
ncbi:cupin domain-containing protein [Halosquirtibacter xylanolyticus]|uniref:cupin domain-containing protein n=1 Tax=Halosquirtibacter xylanolyticus TaxID=3374599 RepID=UPI00374A84DB|nr:cupin domain-containing protein [Prolixibacteraceae bacterium]